MSAEEIKKRRLLKGAKELSKSKKRSDDARKRRSQTKGLKDWKEGDPRKWRGTGGKGWTGITRGEEILRKRIKREKGEKLAAEYKRINKMSPMKKLQKYIKDKDKAASKGKIFQGLYGDWDIKKD